MSLKNFLRARKQASRPASFSWANIKAVFQAGVRKQKKSLGGFEIDEHIYEQIIWRRTQVIANSPRCWYSGACKVCGCDILGKTMEDRACSIAEHPDLLEKRQPCYPAMMDSNEWKKYKKLKNIKLFE